MKRLILYDLDGTLVDTRQDIANAVNHMLRSLGLPQLSVREIEPLVGRGMELLIRDALHSDDPRCIREGVAIYTSYYLEHLTDESRIYPGVPELLAAFRRSVQVVLTNKPEPFTSRLLEALGLRRSFSDVVAGNSGFAKKPDPAAIRWLLGRYGVSRPEALLIGDSPIDLETGRNAGVETVLLTHGFAPEQTLRAAGPELLVSDARELLELVRARGWVSDEAARA